MTEKLYLKDVKKKEGKNTHDIKLKTFYTSMIIYVKNDLAKDENILLYFCST